MEESDNWRKAGAVPGGKLHLLENYVTSPSPDNPYARAHTACHRLIWVDLADWRDDLWDSPGWACQVCLRRVRERLAAEREHPEQDRAEPAFPAPDPALRAERLRYYAVLSTIARQAAQPGPVLPSRPQLTRERDEAVRAARAARSTLEEQGRAIRRMGARIGRDGKELDRREELLIDLRVEIAGLKAARSTLQAENAHLERENLKAEHVVRLALAYVAALTFTLADSGQGSPFARSLTIPAELWAYALGGKLKPRFRRVGSTMAVTAELFS